MFLPDLLQGKRILITGGGTGLGKSMAARFLGLGADVAICGRRADVLKAAAAELDKAAPGRIAWRALDIRDADAVEGAIAALWEEKPLDALVNNAAGNILARTETLSHRAVDAVVGTVLHGAAYLTLACGRRWIGAGRAGNVLSIVTTYAWTGSGYVVPSAMAKAGVLAMTRSLAVEWGPKSIRLNAIAPGPFPTEGAWQRLVPTKELERSWLDRIPLRRFGRHEELTDLAAYLLSDRSGYITGEVVTIDGGEWLKGAGQFNFAETLTEAEWAAMAPKGKTK
ncbi:MAG: SDR family oxidoreductase [Acidimicrobiia bacterium]|nr:SDR family oxidoreductase [Acidimicrobiia bacterium]